MSDYGKCPSCGSDESDTFVMCGSCNEDFVGGDGGYDRFKKAIAAAREEGRAAGYAEAKAAAALKCDEFSRDAATCAAREEADCDIAEADIHSHAANCGRTLARTIRALAPATTKEPA